MSRVPQTALETALELVDLRELVADFYPDTGARPGLAKQRIRAVWRGGDNPEVASLTAKSVHDFKTGDTWNAWTFLTEVAGYSRGDAAAELLRRTGLGDAAPLKRRAARCVAADKRQDERRAEHLKRKLEAATELQRTAPTTGSSAYLTRKGVADLFNTHDVAPVTDATGAVLPGVTFGTDEHGPFAQFALRRVDGRLSGFQRIYDAHCLPGDRDKDFIGEVKGAFVVLMPKGHKLPQTGDALAAQQAAGLEVAICEGVGTGGSIALARPRTLVFCALSAGNLARVAAALRKRYGYTRRRELKRGAALKALELTVWADLDASGRGQEAAHAAAVASECYVRVPAFKRGTGDFNDLHAARGLGAVRRTRKVKPDVTLAFSKELGKQKLSPDKHLAPFALPSSGGALIVKAPQESGKTHRLAELLSGCGLRVLVVTHRESLAKNLSARLRFECYQDYPAHELRHIPQLVICFDSLQKLTIGGALPGYDVLVIDECEQVLEHATGRHIKRKAENFGVLEQLLQAADRIICADADAGALTADALRRFNPARAVTWHRHEHHVAAGRTLRLTADRDDLLDALEAEARPAWVAADSLRFTRDLSAHLGDPHTLTINSETATTPEAKAYLLDPTREAPRHRRMIASPSVQTGLSDDSGHWKHVFGTFSGYTSTPQNAMQALMRPRGVDTLTVYAPRGRGEAVSVVDALEGAAAVDDFEGAALGTEGYGTRNPNYERLQAEAEAQRTRRQTGYKTRLALSATRLGYRVEYDVGRDVGPDELERWDERRAQLKKAGLERYVTDRVGAERIDAARADVLAEKYTRTQAEHFALEQFECRAFYRLPDSATDDELAELLRTDDYKALRRKVLRYESFFEPLEVTQARARGDREAGLLRGDAKAHVLRREFHQRLGRVLGLDLNAETEAAAVAEEVAELNAELGRLQVEREGTHTRRKGEIDRLATGLRGRVIDLEARTLRTTYHAAADSVKAFVRWCVKHYRALKHAGIITASLDNLKAKPLETIGDSLRRCGLKHRHDGKRGAEKHYAVTLFGISGMADYSRPRRENWHFAQQNDTHTLDSSLLCETAVPSSETVFITSDENAKGTPPPDRPPPDPADAAAYLCGLLEAGHLDAFGPQKLGTIRQKLDENAAGWLHRLANSRDVGRVLGVTA